MQHNELVIRHPLSPQLRNHFHFEAPLELGNSHYITTFHNILCICHGIMGFV